MLDRPRLSSDSGSLLSACKVGFSSVAEFSHRSIGTDLCTLTLLADGPAGVRPADGHTQFPAGVTTAATWDRELIYNRSRTMGQEFYDLGKSSR